jgi:transposase
MRPELPTCWRTVSSAVASCRPRAPIQELRDLTRTRRQLVREIARHVLRIRKTLEDANLKLTQVMSDIVGTSGRAILEALIAGETDPNRLADVTRGRLKATRADLRDALHGRVTDHHRFMIKLHLSHVDTLESAVAAIEARIGDALGPFRAAVSLLTTDARHQRNHGSRAHRRHRHRHDTLPRGRSLDFVGRLLPAARRKRRQTTLHAHAPERTVAQTHAHQSGMGRHSEKDSYLPAQFLRIKSRRGAKKASLAVASSMLTAAYFMLRDGVEYHDLGSHHFEQRDKKQLAKRLLQRLRDLGVAVEVKAA